MGELKCVQDLPGFHEQNEGLIFREGYETVTGCANIRKWHDWDDLENIQRDQRRREKS